MHQCNCVPPLRPPSSRANAVHFAGTYILPRSSVKMAGSYVLHQHGQSGLCASNAMSRFKTNLRNRILSVFSRSTALMPSDPFPAPSIDLDDMLLQKVADILRDYVLAPFHTNRHFLTFSEVRFLEICLNVVL